MYQCLHLCIRYHNQHTKQFHHLPKIPLYCPPLCSQTLHLPQKPWQPLIWQLSKKTQIPGLPLEISLKQVWEEAWNPHTPPPLNSRHVPQVILKCSQVWELLGVNAES